MPTPPIAPAPALPGLLYGQAAEYQARLAALEEVAAAQVAAAWSTVNAATQRDLDALIDRVAQATAKGDRLSPSWPFREARYKALMATAAEQQALFSQTAAQVTAQTQATAAAMGAQHAASLGSAALATVGTGALTGTFVAVNPDNLRHLSGFLADGTPLADLLGTLGPTSLDATRAAMVEGIVMGKGAPWLKARLAGTLDVPRWRAETIARTETHRVYREATRETYAANRDVLEGWTWMAHLDHRTCPCCVVMDGTLHSPDEGLDGHPRCRCAMIPRTKDYQGIMGNNLGARLPDTRPPVRSGQAWLQGAPAATQRAVLGPGKFAAWKAGDLDLEDLVTRTSTPGWGTMRREATLGEAKAAKAARLEDARSPEQPRVTWDATPAAQAARWSVNRDVPQWNGALATSRADLETHRVMLRSRTQGLQAAQEDVLHWKGRVSAEQARLKAYVSDPMNAPYFPTAASKAALTRGDQNLKWARENLKQAEANAARHADIVAEAQRKVDALTPPPYSPLPIDPANPLAVYGDRLHFTDLERQTRNHLGDLEEHVPVHTHAILRDHYSGRAKGGLYLGQEKLPDLDDLSDIRGASPRGWAAGSTWDDVGGINSPAVRVTAVSERGWRGATPEGRLTHATAIHEAGHALDDAYQTVLGGAGRASEAPEWARLATALQEHGPRPYYTPAGNPRGHLSELWAESFDGWATGRALGGLDDRAAHLLATVEAHPRGLAEARAVVRYFDDLDASIQARTA